MRNTINNKQQQAQAQRRPAITCPVSERNICSASTMMIRFVLLLALLFALSEAFAPLPALTRSTSAVEPLFSCRTNAKKEKIKRNRENMRKFKTSGRRGTSRRKIMKKNLSVRARQSENEFIAKCFITVPVQTEEEKN